MSNLSTLWSVTAYGFLSFATTLFLLFSLWVGFSCADDLGLMRTKLDSVVPMCGLLPDMLPSDD